MQESFYPGATKRLPPAARWSIAAAAIALGVATSIIASEFFILGLLRVEPDAEARGILIVAGIALIVAELGCVGVASSITRREMPGLKRLLQVFAGVIIAFEIVTVSVTQVALVLSADAGATAAATRIVDLRAGIDSQRATAAGLRANAESQSRSVFRDSREAGAAALRQALDIERGIAAQSAELAQLQSGQRPTLSSILGTTGMIVYTSVRAVLISLVGVLAFHVAGVMVREARRGRVATMTHAGTESLAGVEGTSSVERDAPTAPAAATVVPFPAPNFAKRFAVAAAAPLAAFAAATPAPAPAQILNQMTYRTASASTIAHPSPVMTDSPADDAPDAEAPTDDAPKAKRVRRAAADREEGVRDTGVGELDGARFQRVLVGVLKGEITPSLRGLQRAEGASAPTARRYLAELERRGVIVSKTGGKGFDLVRVQAAA